MKSIKEESKHEIENIKEDDDFELSERYLFYNFYNFILNHN